MNRSFARRSAGIVLLIAAIAAAIAWLAGNSSNGAPRYRTAKVERGPLTASVAASGTLAAVVTVQVGSQISGQIRELNADFNTPVRRNQVIARIDPATFELRVQQARADLGAAQSAVAAARAGLAAQQAQLAQARANLVEARRDLERKESLIAKGFLSPSERDKARTTLEATTEQVRALEAQTAVAQAQIETALAQVKQRQAALAQAEVDLSRTYIRAPVDGIVVSRTVDAGQTVAASLQAPTLFTIAQDLRQMQVEAAIDEADVGRLKLGQSVSFSVDAHPRRGFRGEVKQIRMAPQIAQNVVTYTVVITAPNPDLILLPGMTANVRVITDQRENVLRVPNAALRFRPTGAEDSGGPAGTGRGASTSAASDGPVALPPGGEGAGRSRPATGRVYRAGSNATPQAVELKLGLSDGVATEVLDGEISEGDEVIVGLAESPRKPAAGGPRLF